MIEINFIEHKNRNVVPYLIGAVFALFLFTSIYLLYWQHTNQTQQLQSIQSQLQDNAAEKQELTNLRKMSEQRQTLANQIKNVEGSLFPTIPLLDRLISLLPMNNYIEHYAFSVVDGVEIDIRAEDMNQVAAYTHALNSQTFIENVNLSTVTKNGADFYLASFTMEINEQAWKEEAK